MSVIVKAYKYLHYWRFLLKGRKPLTKGYGIYRDKLLKRALDKNEFSTKSLPNGYGFRVDERIIEYPWLMSRLPSSAGTLLDAGSVLNYPNIISRPVFANKRIFISTLAPESNCFWRSGVSYVYEDIRDACYKNEYFDWVVSLSTIEHIGMDNTKFYTTDASKKESNRNSYLAAIDEFHRVMKPGGRLYLSVPYGKRADHGWLQVFDEKMIEGVVGRFAPVSVETHYFRYVPEGWRVATREECTDATYYDYWHERGYGQDYAAAARAVVCLELVKAA